MYLLEEKWVEFEQIKKFLEIFKEVTIIMSGSSYPTLSMTVPLYNILIDYVKDVIGDENEENQIDDENNSEEEEEEEEEEEWSQVIKNAAKKSKVKLLEYYNKTGDTYLIATILNSHLKLQYYKDQKWDNELISNIYQK